MPREKKYSSAASLEKAIGRYWGSISYERPVVVSTPTGEVTEQGEIKYKAQMLRLDENGVVSHTGVGRPLTERVFLREPSVSGLCRHLGISKQTWSAYKADEALGFVCEGFLLDLEDHLADKLDGNKVKTVQGVIFNLKNNFGWRDKLDVTAGPSDQSVEAYLEKLSAAGERQEF